ncbi:MAG: gas vesicle protein GvpG [Planctomycetia bacterium]|nr:gas vesicle protein GvpG [Planctomycetia bacterium]
MFLIDDVLLAPLKGFASVCQKIYDAAQQDLDDQEKAIVEQLLHLHQQLEAGQISNEEFDPRETALLDRLEAIQASQGDESTVQ